MSNIQIKYDIVNDKERERERERERKWWKARKRQEEKREIRKPTWTQPMPLWQLWSDWDCRGTPNEETELQNIKDNEQGFVPVFDNAIWLDWHLLISKPSLSLCLLSNFEFRVKKTKNKNEYCFVYLIDDFFCDCHKICEPDISCIGCDSAVGPGK